MPGSLAGAAVILPLPYLEDSALTALSVLLIVSAVVIAMGAALLFVVILLVAARLWRRRALTARRTRSASAGAWQSRHFRSRSFMGTVGSR